MKNKKDDDSSEKLLTRRLTTIVATDIRGYSTLSEQSDIQAMKVVDAVFGIFENVVNKYNGRVFKRIADGFLAEFPSAESAMQAAIEFTQVIKEKPINLKGFNTQVDVRTGIHVGDVTERTDGDLLGHGINVAVRLQELANTNGILASHNIINLLGQNFVYQKTRRGSLTLKNISKPIVAFDIVDHRSAYSKVLFSKAKELVLKPVRTGVFLMIGLIMFLMGNTTFNSNILDKRVREVQNSLFDHPSISAYHNELDSSYVYRVLFDLGDSKLSSDQTVFALIETGDVNSAIALLEKKLETIDEKSPEFLSTLHQIGALTFHKDPIKAIETYKKIIEIDGKDVTARRRLARSYGGIGSVCKAKKQYEKALTLTLKDENQKLKIEIDRAFNMYLLGKPKQALEAMAKYENLMAQRMPDITWSQFQTNQGVYLQASGNIIRSEALLTSINARQKALGDEVNISRAYNVLGTINLQKARENLNLRNLYLTSARDQFLNQLRLDKKLNRIHALPELHYLLGETYFEMEKIERAAEQYSMGKIKADENSIVNFQFLNRLGLALIEQHNGKYLKSCSLIKEMQEIYDSKIKTGIGPNTPEKIKSSSCGFIYKPQPMAGKCD